MSLISISNAVIDEGAGFVDLEVYLDHASNELIEVGFITQNQGAGANDYVAEIGRVVFAPGEVNKSIRIQIRADENIEQVENFAVQLINPIGAGLGQGHANVVIIDNDNAAGTPFITIGDIIIDETTEIARFVVQLDRPSSNVVGVDFETQSGSAKQGSDFVAASGSLNFEPGEMVKIVEIALIDDQLAESGEQFSLILQRPNGGVLLRDAGWATIASSDQTAITQPLVSIENGYVSEGRGVVEAVVRLSAPSDEIVSLQLNTLGQQADFDDFAPISQTISFSPGETLRTIQIPIFDDGFDEGIETFSLQLSDVINGALGNDTAVLSIIDDDEAFSVDARAPVILFDDVLVNENAEEALITLRLDRPSEDAISLDYDTISGSAQAGLDYIEHNGSVSFLPGETVATVRIALLEDGLVENTEMFSLSLTNLSGLVGEEQSIAILIADSDGFDQAKTPYISIEDTVVDESSGIAITNVRLSNASLTPVTFSVDSYDGTADESDYAGGFQTFSFAPGETVKQIVTPIIDSDTKESVESFSLELENVSGAIVAKGIGLVTIIDSGNVLSPPDEGVPILLISDILVDEASGEAVFNLRLDGQNNTPFTVEFTTSDGSATAGEDYTAVSGSVTFVEGKVAHAIRVPILNDTMVEGDEGFTLTVSQTDMQFADEMSINAVIAANDGIGNGAPELSITLFNFEEANGFVELQLLLSAPSSTGAGLTFSTLTDSANEGDFQEQFFRVEFAPGQTAQVLRLAITDDNQKEMPEYFTLELENLVGLTVQSDVLHVPIFDSFSGGEGFAGFPYFAENPIDQVLLLHFEEVLFGQNVNDVLFGGSPATGSSGLNQSEKIAGELGEVMANNFANDLDEVVMLFEAIDQELLLPMPAEEAAMMLTDGQDEINYFPLQSSQHFQRNCSDLFSIRQDHGEQFSSLDTSEAIIPWVKQSDETGANLAKVEWFVSENCFPNPMGSGVGHEWPASIQDESFWI